MGKLRTNADAGVAALSKEIVKLWKDKIEENKKKRKREDGEGSGVKKEEEGKDKDIKRVKAEGESAVRSLILQPSLHRRGMNKVDSSFPLTEQPPPLPPRPLGPRDPQGPTQSPGQKTSNPKPRNQM